MQFRSGRGILPAGLNSTYLRNCWAPRPAVFRLTLQKGTAVNSRRPSPFAEPFLFALVGEREVVELQLFVAIAGVGKELVEKIAHQLGFDAVVIVLAVAPKTDQPRHAEES